MRPHNRELWAAFVAILFITLGYLFVVIMLGGVPAASSFFGHSLGVIGFLLMLSTETLYTLRKRSRQARWGRMSIWLEFHIFTGLVGPYLVLLHSSWKFNGLAGVVLLLTGVVVASGFIGRYIYTAIPRTADGMELEADEIHRQISRLEAELGALSAGGKTFPGLQQRLALWLPRNPLAGLALWLPRNPLAGLALRLQIWLDQRRLSPAEAARYQRLDQLLTQRERLMRQVAALAQARRLMGLWHSVHLPLGLALFSAAFIHIVAAIYYATLLR